MERAEQEEKKEEKREDEKGKPGVRGRAREKAEG